jgi:Concanavalin A-like lectin/glucanases superfamily
MTVRSVRCLVMMMAALALAASASAGVVLKLGDIIYVSPGGVNISVIDGVTGDKTVISDGGFLAPEWLTVGAALALDGDIIAVHRVNGLIRINPVTGSQSILSQGGLFRDPWAIAIDKDTGYIYIADSGYDNARPVNEAGKIIRVDPTTGAQQLIASGSPCTVFPSNVACQNTTSSGSYLAHPYGIAIDYTGVPGTLIVADMGSFNGKGAIVRVNPVPNGSQTLLWGPASAVPAPQVAQISPLGCPMGVALEPNGNILTTSFTFPVPALPIVPPPVGTFYGCAPPGIFRIDLINNSQTVVSADAPVWQPNRAYSVGAVVRAGSSASRIHQVVTAGTSQGGAPNWNSTLDGTTVDGSVVWRNIGPGATWLIPFGLDVEPAPTPANPLAYNIIVPDEGHGSVFRLGPNGQFIASGVVAVETSHVTSIDVITFTPTGGFKVEPIPSNGSPEGLLPSGTTATTLSLETDVDATCRYSLQPGTVFGSMPYTFATTGSTTHSTPVNGLTDGGSYLYYVRCMSTTGDLNSADFVVSFAVAEVPPPPSITPVAAYNFDEGGGPMLADYSGNSNHGTVSGAAWTTQGRYGGALSFDGVNDWVTVANSATLSLSTGMTLEAWVYPTANGGGSWRNIVIKERASGEVYNLYSNTEANRPAVYVVRASQPGSAIELRGSSQLPVNAWTHLAATFDGTTLRMFRNGVQFGSRAVSGPLLTSTGPLQIGGNSLWGEFFQGRMDDLRIYNRALTAAEVLADMSAPVEGALVDTIPAFRFSGYPSGTLAWGTTQTTVSLSTNEDATCRYGPQAGVTYGSMTNTFTTTGGTTHALTLSGLTNGSSHSFYVRCADASSNANTDDFVITFSVAGTSATTSAFVGVQSPLSENGLWDSPGSWNDLQKSDGAYTNGLNASGRLVTPVGPDQYSEVTYDQDPGGSSWVGVMTRIQAANNGSGYLAIAYAGEVRLYRVDDAGALSFTLLASANASTGGAPRRLRLESEVDILRVFFNGALLINHNATGTVYWSGQPGIAASVFGGPLVKIQSFEGGILAAGDHPPFRFNGQPSGMLSWGTTQTTVSLNTNENATCRYSVQAAPYDAMTNTFTTTGGTTHSRTLSGLTNGSNHGFYVRCMDAVGNQNTDDFVIAFSVAATSGTASSFAGVQSPLSENGLWDSPGSWTDLQKNNGAYTNGLNAAGRLVAPSIGSDQYVEITYDQDPGASSWIGVMTRIQGISNGSGYLAIVYAGEVRLYRADDAGGLNFTLLASASTGTGIAPRRLRLESQGNFQRVYFNGTPLIDHNATGTIYSSGQPGIAASVFGGPQVKILSFEAGNLSAP